MTTADSSWYFLNRCVTSCEFCETSFERRRVTNAPSLSCESSHLLRPRATKCMAPPNASVGTSTLRSRSTRLLCLLIDREGRETALFCSEPKPSSQFQAVLFSLLLL